MSRESDSWKDKYRELANESEEAQKNADRLTLSLEKIITALSMGLEGGDPSLDADLVELKQQIEQADTRKLDKVRGRLDKRLRDRDTSRERHVRGVLEQLLAWAALLRGRLEETYQLDQLKTLEDQAAGLVDQEYELPNVLKGLLSLEKQASPVAPEEAASANLVETAGIDEPATQTARSNESELLLVIAAELSALVNALSSLSDSATDPSRVILQQLDGGVTLEKLPNVLTSLVSLVGLVRSDNANLERFLIGLSAQISEVQQFIADNRQDQTLSDKHHQQLDKTVRENVAAINEVVEASNNLQELKTSVATQLSDVMRTMDKFRRSEANRTQRLKERYDHLLTKVQQMESDNKRFQAHFEAEKAKASTDALTGLPNRFAYDERLTEALSAFQRYDTNFSMVVGDIDFFKRINDGYGHLAGDKVLKLISKVIRAKVRKSDFVARYGGEEFVIIMPSTKAKDAVLAMDKVRKAVAASPFNFHGKPVSVTISFGLTEVQENDTAESVFSRADKLLYRAKSEGRDRVVCES